MVQIASTCSTLLLFVLGGSNCFGLFRRDLGCARSVGCFLGTSYCQIRSTFFQFVWIILIQHVFSCLGRSLFSCVFNCFKIVLFCFCSSCFSKRFYVVCDCFKLFQVCFFKWFRLLMLFRVVSDHFSSVFLVADCVYLFQVVFQMFCFVLTSFQFSDVEFGCSALFYVVFGGL